MIVVSTALTFQAPTTKLQVVWRRPEPHHMEGSDQFYALGALPSR
jgi:hypothetical protein